MKSQLMFPRILTRKGLTLGIIIFAAASLGRAQDLAINWSTFCSSATSTGGVYSLSATVGQVSASESAAGQYSLAGGFWVPEATAVPSMSRLEVARSAGSLVFSWPASTGNYVLKSTSNLATGTVWTTVPQTPILIGDRYTVTVPMNKPREFFVLAKSP